MHYEKFDNGTVKCIEEEIPFDEPEGWSWVRLGDIGQYKKGPFGSSITKAMFVPDSPTAVKVYEQKNAINKDDSLGNYFISEEKYQSLRGFEVFPNDIIVSCAGTIGETYVLPKGMRKGIINQALMKISLYNLGMLEFYLVYFDFQLKASAQEHGHGIALKNIPPFDVLKKYLMPVPPLQEQSRIIRELASILQLLNAIDADRADISDLITRTKEKVLDLAIRGKLVPQNPEDEPAAVLLERIRAEKEMRIKQGTIKRDKRESIIFRGDDNSYYRRSPDGLEDITDDLPYDIPDSWEWTSISELFSINPRNKIAEDMVVSFIPMPLIDDGYSGCHRSETKEWKSIKTGFSHFQNGDIGIAKITPCFENRKSVIFRDLCNGYGAGTTELHILRPQYRDCVLPEYALALLKSERFIQSGVQAFTGAVGQQRIGKDYVMNTYFSLPPYAEQRRIIDRINKLFTLIATIESAL